MIEDLNLWAAQDALLAALAEQDDLDDVAQSLGFPKNVEPDHVIVTGEATGSLAFELTGAQPSAETFRLTVVVYTQRAEEYVEVRDRLKGFAAAVERALASAGFAAVVPAWSIPDYRLEAGSDGTNRQLSLAIVVECRCW